jgi:asparagine synthase (glutamine-hydrolysing)
MCGIWATLGSWCTTVSKDELFQYILRLKARGPEYTGYAEPTETSRLGFTRLAINGLTDQGNQPFQDLSGNFLVCNGEIYNYQQLAERHQIPLSDGSSDCEVLLPLFLNKGLTLPEACRAIDGVFAIVCVDQQNKRMIIARDPYGVRPLFEAQREDGSHVWSSELKALPEGCDWIRPFPPGSVKEYCLKTGILKQQFRYHTNPCVKIPTLTAADLRMALEAAVEKRLMSDRPVGALLSGGLDSSLVAAIAARAMAFRGQRLHTFSIGMPGSTDLAYAKQVAHFIGSEHHEILLSRQDFLDAIEQVIPAIESYDITTVRASVGNWLVGKWIKDHTDIKVVLNGDGSDEIGGGYLYFYRSPSEEAFESETARLLEEIHMYDVLRSDRCISSHGLEPRTPFLDKQVVATWLSLQTVLRRPQQEVRVEKQVLREAFQGTGLLPDAVLWRKKEAFSDGVSSEDESWYVTVARHAEESGLGKDVGNWTHNPPQTAEGVWYRQKFEALYGEEAAYCIPHMWMPKWTPGAKDPSARTW